MLTLCRFSVWSPTPFSGVCNPDRVGLRSWGEPGRARALAVPRPGKEAGGQLQDCSSANAALKWSGNLQPSPLVWPNLRGALYPPHMSTEAGDANQERVLEGKISGLGAAENRGAGESGLPAHWPFHA